MDRAFSYHCARLHWKKRTEDAEAEPERDVAQLAHATVEAGAAEAPLGFELVPALLRHAPRGGRDERRVRIDCGKEAG